MEVKHIYAWKRSGFIGASRLGYLQHLKKQLKEIKKNAEGSTILAVNNYSHQSPDKTR